MKIIRKRKSADSVDEEKIEDIQFNVFKFNNRPKPTDKRQILIICAFSEFGCETVGAMYCIPRLMQEYPGYYKIVIGWYGREYLYRHLADEFWEMHEEHQGLREFCRAFHHDSKNLSRLEKNVSKYGLCVPSHYLGTYVVLNRCLSCQYRWRDLKYVRECCKCEGKDVERSLFGDVRYWKKFATRVPSPSEEAVEAVKKYIKPNSVGVFARGRKAYGRNLQPEFYVKLISMLEDRGHNVIWLGEKATCQPCPVDHIVDFSRSNESRDLEKTLAIVSQLKFTVQFWTASTRLAGMMGIPYILFESPDQIWGNGQEGFRRNLCDFGPSKLAVCHYLSVYEDNDVGVALVKQCINEIEDGNYKDVVGMVETDAVVPLMMQENAHRIGGEYAR